jgi:hypothetical protein
MNDAVSLGVAPRSPDHLCHHDGRNHHRHTFLLGDQHERAHPAVTADEGEDGARIED